METSIKGVEIVVHRTCWVTDEGHVCLKWPAYFVAVGKNPRGPRGGVNGMVVDGRFVGGRFRTYEDAAAYAERYKARLEAGTQDAQGLAQNTGRGDAESLARPFSL